MAQLNVTTPVLEQRVQFHYRVESTVVNRTDEMNALAHLRGMPVREEFSPLTFARIVTLWFTKEQAAEFHPAKHGKIEAAKRFRRILRKRDEILESDQLDWNATYLRSGVVDCLVTYEGDKIVKVSPVKPRPVRQAA